MMARFKWLVIVLAASLALSACAKKQTTPVQEPPPPAPVAEPAPSPPPPPPPVVKKEKPIVLEDIYFDFDRYAVKDEYKAILTRNAEILMANAEKRILVEGHCDERGTNEYNMALGEKRAKAVVDFYTSYGIPANRITWISYGEEKPFATGHNEEAWAQNRRAHMVVQ
jgi:peptidoglycan-associated lipoprotein